MAILEGFSRVYRACYYTRKGFIGFRVCYHTSSIRVSCMVLLEVLQARGLTATRADDINPALPRIRTYTIIPIV